MITQAWLIVAFMVTPPSMGYKEIYVFKTKDVLTSSEFCLDYVGKHRRDLATILVETYGKRMVESVRCIKEEIVQEVLEKYKAEKI